MMTKDDQLTQQAELLAMDMWEKDGHRGIWGDHDKTYEYRRLARKKLLDEQNG